MYTVTKAFHDACKSPGREIYLKAKFNGETDLPRSELQEMTLTEQFGSSDGVTIGAAFSSSCKLTMYKQEGLALKNGYFTPYVGLKAADNEVTYIPKGVFYVPTDGVDDSGKLWVTVTGYDRMASLTADYIPAITLPATPAQILADVCTQAKVTAPNVTLPDIQIETAYSGSLREQLGWLAGLIGCNAKFDATGNLVFCWYADSGLTLGWDVQHLDGLERTADEPFTINSLLTGTEENPISVGSGIGITAINPYMTEEVATAVLDLIKDKPMTPCKCKWRGDPSVEAGDILTVVDCDGVSGLSVFVMEQELHVSGGMSCDTTCYGVEDADYAVKSSTAQKLQRMYNEVMDSFQNATEKIIGMKGGYFAITYDEDGFPTGWTLKDTPTVTDTTKMWIMSMGGLGYSEDGGKTISKVAITMDGYLNGSALAVGSVSQDSVAGLSQSLTLINGQLDAKISKEDAEAQLNSRLSVMADQIQIDLSRVSNQVDDLSDSVNSRMSDYDKWFRFTADGLMIGENGNELTLRVDNDRIAFLQSGSEVAYFSNRRLYVTDAQFLVSVQIGNFAFVPRANGNLSFKKVVS
jgi:hypothetical protein|nr:MAG TPA: Minor structural protein [Caudoviricetes sp.]